MASEPAIASSTTWTPLSAPICSALRTASTACSGPTQSAVTSTSSAFSAFSLIWSACSTAYSSSSDSRPSTPTRSTVLSSSKCRSPVASGTYFTQTTIFMAATALLCLRRSGVFARLQGARDERGTRAAVASLTVTLSRFGRCRAFRRYAVDAAPALGPARRRWGCPEIFSGRGRGPVPVLRRGEPGEVPPVRLLRDPVGARRGRCAGGARTPGPVAETRLPPREIRKTVTLLFTDLKDSTALTGSIDAEAMNEIKARYFAAMATRDPAPRRRGREEHRRRDHGRLRAHPRPARTTRSARCARPTACRSGAGRAERGASSGSTASQITDRTGVNTGEIVANLDPDADQNLATGRRRERRGPPGAERTSQ